MQDTKKRNKKTFLPDFQELRMEEVRKMKTNLEGLDVNKLIGEALDVSKKLQNKEKKKDDLLLSTKARAVSSFLTDLKNKNQKEMKAVFESHIEEYNVGTQTIISKTKKENEQYIKKYESIKEENTNLASQITQLNNEFRKIENQLKESEHSIDKLQSRFELFNKHKALFDEFVKEFNDMNPIEAIKEILSRKEEVTSLINEYNRALRIIDEMKKQKMIDEKASRKTIDELSQKIYEMELNKKDQSEQYQKEIISLQNELIAMKEFKEENILLHKMLFRLYNMLFEEFRLDRNISIKDEFLNIKETDFSPNLFDNEEIGRYIGIMIASMKHETCDKLLRETIACANMMVRKYLKDKVNLRYDPVSTFKNLKIAMDKREERIVKLNENNKNYEIQINKLLLENKHLLSELHHLKSQITGKVRHRANSIAIKQKVNLQKAGLKKSSSLPHFKPKPKSLLKQRNKSYEEKSTKGKKEQSNNEEKILAMSDSSRRDRLSDLLSSSSFSIERNANIAMPIECEEFKQMKKSKNGDKLLKTHGFQSGATNLKGFKDLVNHTNRLLLYKVKMEAKHKNHLRGKSFKCVLDKQRPLTASKSVDFDNNLCDNIIGRLNKMISSIERSNKS